MRSQIETLKKELNLPLPRRDMCRCDEDTDSKTDDCKCCPSYQVPPGTGVAGSCTCNNEKCPARISPVTRTDVEASDEEPKKEEPDDVEALYDEGSKIEEPDDESVALAKLQESQMKGETEEKTSVSSRTSQKISESDVNEVPSAERMSEQDLQVEESPQVEEKMAEPDLDLRSEPSEDDKVYQDEPDVKSERSSSSVKRAAGERFMFVVVFLWNDSFAGEAPKTKKNDIDFSNVECIDPKHCQSEVKGDAGSIPPTSIHSMFKIVNKDDPNAAESQIIYYNAETGEHCHCSISLQKTALKIQLDDNDKNEEYILVDGPVCLPRNILENKTIPVMIQNVSSMLLDSDMEFHEREKPSYSKVNLFHHRRHSGDHDESYVENMDSVSGHIKRPRETEDLESDMTPERDTASEAGGQKKGPILKKNVVKSDTDVKKTSFAGSDASCRNVPSTSERKSDTGSLKSDRSRRSSGEKSREKVAEDGEVGAERSVERTPSIKSDRSKRSSSGSKTGEDIKSQRSTSSGGSARGAEQKPRPSGSPRSSKGSGGSQASAKKCPEDVRSSGSGKMPDEVKSEKSKESCICTRETCSKRSLKNAAKKSSGDVSAIGLDEGGERAEKRSSRRSSPRTSEQKLQDDVSRTSSRKSGGNVSEKSFDRVSKTSSQRSPTRKSSGEVSAGSQDERGSRTSSRSPSMKSSGGGSGGSKDERGSRTSSKSPSRSSQPKGQDEVGRSPSMKSSGGVSGGSKDEKGSKTSSRSPSRTSQPKAQDDVQRSPSMKSSGEVSVKSVGSRGSTEARRDSRTREPSPEERSGSPKASKSRDSKTGSVISDRSKHSKKSVTPSEKSDYTLPKKENEQKPHEVKSDHKPKEAKSDRKPKEAKSEHRPKEEEKSDEPPSVEHGSDFANKYHYLLLDAATSTSSCEVHKGKSRTSNMTASTKGSLTQELNMLLVGDEYKMGTTPEEHEEVATAASVTSPPAVPSPPPSGPPSLEQASVSSRSSPHTPDRPASDLRIYKYSNRAPSRILEEDMDRPHELTYMPRKESDSFLDRISEIESYRRNSDLETEMKDHEPHPGVYRPEPLKVPETDTKTSSNTSTLAQQGGRPHEGLKVRYSLTRDIFDQEHQDIIAKLDEKPVDSTKERDDNVAVITDKMKEFRKIESEDNTNRRFQVSNPENFEIRRLSGSETQNSEEDASAKKAKRTCCGLNSSKPKRRVSSVVSTTESRTSRVPNF
jgi:hypothetical protein